ncbi:hypothetical protein HOY80DRAFT_1047056 [Tuber brumale]|nr:hypothetical protein HOY80DRAFT_1047056 [Tuber brumale]
MAGLRQAIISGAAWPDYGKSAFKTKARVRTWHLTALPGHLAALTWVAARFDSVAAGGSALAQVAARFDQAVAWAPLGFGSGE